MPNPDGPDIRIGDAEREKALSALREAAADGRITLSELDERIDAVLRSRIRADLRDVLLDIVPGDQISALFGVGVPVRTKPGHHWSDPLVLSAGWNDLSKRGVWEVPPFLETHSVAANVLLDLTLATVSAPVTDIVHLGGAGDLILVIPPAFGVDTDRVTGGLGRVRNRVRPRPEPGHPQIVVRGSLGLGDIRVRYPNSWDRMQQGRHRKHTER